MQIHFFNPVACCFLYKAKDLSVPPRLFPSCVRQAAPADTVS
jgi:hypothetical protein